MEKTILAVVTLVSPLHNSLTYLTAPQKARFCISGIHLLILRHLIVAMKGNQDN